MDLITFVERAVAHAIDDAGCPDRIVEDDCGVHSASVDVEIIIGPDRPPELIAAGEIDRAPAVGFTVRPVRVFREALLRELQATNEPCAARVVRFGDDAGEAPELA